jgi:hypothetical protein
MLKLRETWSRKSARQAHTHNDLTLLIHPDPKVTFCIRRAGRRRRDWCGGQYASPRDSLPGFNGPVIVNEVVTYGERIAASV